VQQCSSGTGCRLLGHIIGKVLCFKQDFALEDTIGFHVCSIEANMRAI
jgi:hypothetical protein